MKKNYQIFILLLILAIGLFLRIYDLGAESLWTDEGASINVSYLDIFQILDYSINDFHPPLYFILLHYWVNLFGSSEFAVRSLSMLFGFLGIFMIYKVGRVLFNKNTGILSALLLALSVFHIRYSQEARMYGLLVFLTLVSFYFFIKLVKQKSRKDTIWYILSSTLLIYTHVYGLFIIIAQNTFFFTMLLISKERHGLSIKRWISLQGILAIIFLPWLSILINQIVQSQSGHWWIPQPSLSTLWMTFKEFAGSKRLLVSFLALLPTSLLTYKKIEGKLNWKKLSDSLQGYRWMVGLSGIQGTYLLGIWLLTPIVFPFIISLFRTPIYHTRYTIVASLALYVLVARGISNINYKYIKVAVIGVFVVFSLTNVFQYYVRVNNAQWREVAYHIDTNADRGDLVLFDADFGQFDGFDFYSQRKDVVKMPLYKKTIKDTNKFGTIVDTYNKVWIVLSHSRIGRTLVEERFAEFYNLAWHKKFEGIEVFVFKKESSVFSSCYQVAMLYWRENVESNDK